MIGWGGAKYRSGMTLIEILIAVVIVGILAAIAYPSYINQVRTSRRADAQQALMSLASAMERYHSQNLTYAGAADDGDDSGPPAIFPDEAPLDGGRKYYNLRITAASVDDYILQAQPKNDQAGDGLLQVTADGGKGWDRDGNGSIGASEQCWGREC